MSSLISTVVFSLRITTSFNIIASPANENVPRLVLELIFLLLISCVLKEINSILMLYVAGIASKLNSPFSSVIPPATLFGFAAFTIVMVAYSKGWFEVLSTIFPVILSFDDCGFCCE